MQLFYRISDKGYLKMKLPGATKSVCLDNFIEAFPDCHLTVICDNCDPATVEMVRQRTSNILETSLGNSGSMMFAIDQALKSENMDEPVYFCEDDYLHLPNAKGVFEEGLGLGHYVTLFDHPDKYTQAYDFGETSKVRKTLSCHWRFTASTCMTFGTKVGNLKADYEIFKKHCRYEHPHDHFIFMELKSLGRLLALSIPGAACHTDLTVSANIGTVVIDEWAMYLMIAQLYKLLKGKDLGSTAQGLVNKAGEAKTVWEQLVNLDVALTCT